MQGWWEAKKTLTGLLGLARLRIGDSAMRKVHEDDR